MTKHTLLVLLVLTGGIALAAETPSLQERKEKIKQMEKKAPPEAVKRKERSEALLRSQDVPVNKFLPVIETESEAKRRTKDEIAFRALALLVIAVKGEGLEQPIVERLVKDYGLERHFTPKEKAFIKNVAPSQQDRINSTWRYEAAWTLLWALGYVEKLDKPSSICDVPRAVQFMKDRNAKQFISDSKLRPISEILDQADLIYRYHWATTDARINNKKAPANLEPGVVLERHYALNWLIGYMNQEWDDISTDT